ncbi:MAG: hypothetical protein WBB74_07930 [Gaiellaceae bacterium]
MNGGRRLSQAISEGDGISVIARVDDADTARVAEQEGAEGIAIARRVDGVREATSLPILLDAHNEPDEARDLGADAVMLAVVRIREDDGRLEDLHARAGELGLESVVDVRDEEELELALERLDPEIVLLSARQLEPGDEALDHVLELLPSVPAGKLAIAGVSVVTRDEVVALERAGVDAVLVATGNVAELVGITPPPV